MPGQGAHGELHQQARPVITAPQVTDLVEQGPTQLRRLEAGRKEQARGATPGPDGGREGGSRGENPGSAPQATASTGGARHAHDVLIRGTARMGGQSARTEHVKQEPRHQHDRCSSPEQEADTYPDFHQGCGSDRRAARVGRKAADGQDRRRRVQQAESE